MIPKTSKFPMRTEFVHFRSHASRVATPHTSFLLLHTSRESRLAVVVPKKVSKLATTRTWLKRLVYDSVWPVVKDKGVDCVVVFKPLPLTRTQKTCDMVMSEIKYVADSGKPVTDRLTN
jgi:ribonuclease P protein component